MATSGYKTIAATHNIDLKFTWERESYSIADNSSVIAWKMQLISHEYGDINSSAAKKWEVTVNSTKYSGSNRIAINPNSTLLLASGRTTIKHNTDGSKTFSFSFSQELSVTYSGSWVGTKSGNGTGTLDSIPRQATITAAPNFNDEANPAITYSNPAGSAVDELQACIASSDGATIYVAYRDISKTGTSYTFNLTDAERKKLRAATVGSNSLAVRFYVKTIIGDSTYYSKVSKTMTIINGSPTLSPTVVDSNATTIALTGDSNKLIKYYSNAEFTAGAAALKEATIKSITVVNGGKTIKSSSGTFNAVESNSFKFTVTDSRGNTTTKTVTKTLVGGTKPTCKITTTNPTATGEMSLTVSGSCFAGSFGEVTNECRIYYRYKESGSDTWIGDNTSASGWILLSDSTDTNNDDAFTSATAYSAKTTITGLDYQKAYDIQGRIYSTIQSVNSSAKTVRTIPVFDWGANDFKHSTDVILVNSKRIYGTAPDGSKKDALNPSNANGNTVIGYGNYTAESGDTNLYGNNINIIAKGTIKIGGKIYAANQVLWSGAYYMKASHTIPLSSAISEQANGVVLVFSRYESGAVDNDWNCKFIPKYLIAEKGGNGHSLFLTNGAKLHKVAAKYLYISDKSITGHDLNTASGTADSGIIYDNSYFVLRYVIGV